MPASLIFPPPPTTLAPCTLRPSESPSAGLDPIISQSFSISEEGTQARAALRGRETVPLGCHFLPEVKIYFTGFQPRLHIVVTWGAFTHYQCLSPSPALLNQSFWSYSWL